MVILALLAACAAPPGEPEAHADADADTDTDTDTGSEVVAPATEGTLSLAFDVDAEAVGSDRLDDVTILGAAGTLGLDGVTHLAVAYQDHAWDGTPYHLYDLLSVAEDGSNLAVTYLYCQETALPYAYTESFRHPMDWESTSGACDGRSEASRVDVAFPALVAAPTPFDPGVRIEGDGVAWDGADGHVTLGGVERALRPFNTVDCTDCPGGPWLEVHSLLDGSDDACFAILYLFPDDPSYVQVSYGICLPTLERVEAMLDAGWEGALVAAPRPPGLHRPRPVPAVRGAPPR